MPPTSLLFLNLESQGLFPEGWQSQECCLMDLYTDFLLIVKSCILLHLSGYKYKSDCLLWESSFADPRGGLSRSTNQCSSSLTLPRKLVRSVLMTRKLVIHCCLLSHSLYPYFILFCFFTFILWDFRKGSLMMSVVSLPCLKRSQEASVINNFNLENNKIFFFLF